MGLVVACDKLHNLRLDLAAAGKSVLQIMRAGRWTHLESVERYVSKADVDVWAG